MFIKLILLELIRVRTYCDSKYRVLIIIYVCMYSYSRFCN